MNSLNKKFIGVASALLVSSAALWEGYAPKPYKDIAGVLTYCYGETQSVQNKIYTKQECTDLLKDRLAGYGKQVLQSINVPINENEYSAYTLFAYNVGVAGFQSSRALRELNKGHHEEACKALSVDDKGKPAWSYIDKGKTFVPGLYKRRQYETKLCLGQIILNGQ